MWYIKITSAFSAKFIPVNRFEVAVMAQKLQHILLQVTEDGFDPGADSDGGPGGPGPPCQIIRQL